MAGEPIVVFYDAKSLSAIAFSRVIDGRVATFQRIEGPEFLARDSVISGTWDMAGEGVSGDAEGPSLSFIISYISEWYGWSAYHPSTTIYGE